MQLIKGENHMGDHDKPTGLSAVGLQDVIDQGSAQAAVQKAADAKATTQRHDAELGAGTDPDYVQTDEHFEGMTLEALYAAVHGGADGSGGMDAAGLHSMRQTWYDCYSDVVNAASFNLMGMNRVFGNGLWQGASGSAAQSASQLYGHVANQVGRVFESMSSRLDGLAWAAEAVKLAVQAPPATTTVTPDPNNQVESILPGLINPSFSDQQDSAKEQARQAAIRALNTIYKGSFPPSGSGVPTYADVAQVAANPDANVGSPTTSPDPSTGPHPTDSNDPSKTPGKDPAAPQDPSSQNPKDPTGTQPTSTNPSSTNPSTVNPTRTGQPSATPTSPATTTTPAGLSPSPTSPGTPSPTRTSPGQPVSNTPRTDARTGSPGTPRPGAPIPGVPGTGAPLPGTSKAARSAATRTSTGPMAPGAAGRRKEDDEGEHRAPDYLRGVADDWTAGLETPVGVIGADLIHEDDPLFRTDPLPPPPVLSVASTPSVASVDYPTTPPPANPPIPPAPIPPAPSTATPGGGETDSAASNSDTGGFSGTGPAIDDLLAEYGWSMETTSSAATEPGTEQTPPPASTDR
ncbi:hypothetical protein [Nocardia arthritidis]|uniref:PPE domain-containing protein n=1 Tax=Nocardia arthritidis TaxID=228602 RepID=A0A6G9Y9C5_9NOCA|nr:hypothetical protein [Nocardia arthritidis]QIS09829.1 hypothetical protein F5544_09645 [Nocardia arthritidis]